MTLESDVDLGIGREDSFNHLQRFPRLAARLISRPALISRLDRLAALTLVQALAGYGKTQLLGSWAQTLWNTGTVVEWIDATETMNAPHVLRSRVHQAIMQATDDDDRVVIIIDNADVIDDPDVIEQILHLLTRVPGLHLVVCSRFEHPVHEAAEQLKIDLNVLTGRELTLSPEELPQFVESRGHEFSQAQLNELRGLTGGWLQPARLILDSTPTDSDVLSLRAAERYLRTFVLPQVSNDVQLDIAFRLAVARTVTAEIVGLLLADSAHDTAHGEEYSPVDVIDKLVVSGLFERVDERASMPTWRFPRLVRAVLLDEFTIRSPELAAATHRLLARHYEEAENRSLESALTHARAGRDWAFMNQIVREHSLMLAWNGSAEMISAFVSLPDEALESFPSLTLAATMVETLAPTHSHRNIDTDTPANTDSDRGRALLRSYTSVGEGNLTELTAFGSVAELNTVAVAELVSLRVAGLIDEALDLAVRIDAELSVRRSRGEVGGFTGRTAWFRFQWGMTALLVGDVERSTQLSRDAFDVAADEGNEVVASNAAAQLSLIHTLGGDSIDAERWLAAHSRFERKGSATDYLIGIPARIAQAHRALDDLDSDSATAELVAAGDPAQDLEMWAFIAEAATRHALLFGEPIAVLARMEHLSVVHTRVLTGGGYAQSAMAKATIDLLLALGELNLANQRLLEADRSGLQLTVQRARLHLIAGDAEKAQTFAASGIWDAVTSVRDRIELLLIAAVAQLESADHPAAVQSFTRAHALAVHVGTLTPYTSIPRDDLESLLRLSGIALAPDSHDRIARHRSVFPRRAQLVILTGREQTVLVELEKTDSIAEIAATLSVSVNTVKKQTISIYAKLGVHDRAAALARAHQLGLLGVPQSARA